MKKILLIIGLIGAAILAYYCLSNHSVDIQKDITTRLTQNFSAQGVSNNINVSVSGRDVTLTGVVPEEILKVNAGKTASALHGVRVVNNQIKVVEPPPVVLAPIAPAIITPAIEEEPIFDLGAPLMEEQEPVVIAVPEVQPEPVVEEPVVVAQPVEIEKPLVVNRGRIIRRDVDSVTARKTVEAECETSLTSLLQGQKIHFDSGRATIKSSSHDLLDRTVVAAKKCHEDTIITINGYTDNTGDAQANRRLSLERARAVGKYMLKRGVAKQVKVVGNGANDPIADNDTEEGRAKNRRIEFKVFTAASE